MKRPVPPPTEVDAASKLAELFQEYALALAHFDAAQAAAVSAAGRLRDAEGALRVLARKPK